METTTRKEYIDAVKGVNILLVLFSHAQGIPVVGSFFTRPFMAVFFIVAGYTYRRREETLGHFIRQKAKRLLIPYFVYAAGLWALDCALEKLSPAEIVRGGYGVLYGRHCLFLYDGTPASFFLLNNWNGQLWFLPAMFLSYLLFWPLVKCRARVRGWLIVLYLGITCAQSFLPILLPWSLDTVFATSVMIYMGCCLQRCAPAIERFEKKQLFHWRTLFTLSGAFIVYLLLAVGNRDVNLSVRQWGTWGAAGVFVALVLGAIATVTYLLCFSMLEKEKGGRKITAAFSCLGRCSITLLGTHWMVYRLMDTILWPEVFQDCTYWLSLVMIGAAVCVGLALRGLFKSAAQRIALFKYL